jgi:hypothetical protein
VPFTLAHPAAVLPIIRRRWLDASCLVIGSMSPDFEYFALGEHRGNFGHTWLGLFVWCLPVTLASAAIFHAFVLPALLRATPDSLACRFRPNRWRLSLAAVVSALIGATTHILWDHVTHSKRGNGWAYRHYPEFFGHALYLPIIGPTRVERVLWYGSTLVGLAIVAVYVARAVARRPVVELSPVSRTGPRVIFAACIAAGVALVVGRAMMILDGDIDDLVVATISGVIAGAVVASALVRAVYR